jgi:hypothetical protein
VSGLRVRAAGAGTHYAPGGAWVALLCGGVVSTPLWAS